MKWTRHTKSEWEWLLLYVACLQDGSHLFLEDVASSEVMYLAVILHVTWTVGMVKSGCYFTTPSAWYRVASTRYVPDHVISVIIVYMHEHMYSVVSQWCLHYDIESILEGYCDQTQQCMCAWIWKACCEHVYMCYDSRNYCVEWIDQNLIRRLQWWMSN